MSSAYDAAAKPAHKKRMPIATTTSASSRRRRPVRNVPAPVLCQMQQETTVTHGRSRSTQKQASPDITR